METNTNIRTVLNNESITQNFSIKAAIHSASVNDKDD